ncbi:MAG: lipase family protein [Sphingomonadales bacterium]
MKLLPPKLAASLADTVYAINDNPLLETGRPRSSMDAAQDRGLLLGIGGQFAIRPPQSGDAYPFMRAQSGGSPLPGGNWMASQLDSHVFTPVRSDFGYIATGEGEWQRHMVIVTRGTMGPETSKISPDWLTNYNIGMDRGPGGHKVHAGFHRVWAQFRDFVDAAVATYKPELIHCVGHSLGGALATLNAVHVAQSTGRPVALYTFGAPRVGALPFATEASWRLSGRLKRVYHPADPVPMIPLLPFLHAPLSSGIRLPNEDKGIMDGSAHNMTNSYRRLVSRFDDWGGLENANVVVNDFQIELWLRMAAKGGNGGFLMRSTALLETIGHALSLVVARAAFYVLGSGISAAATSMLTSLDYLAWLLERGAEMVDTLREQLTGLVNAIFGYLGRIANSAADLSRKALRWVLDLLFSMLASAARVAIDRLW